MANNKLIEMSNIINKFFKYPIVNDKMQVISRNSNKKNRTEKYVNTINELIKITDFNSKNCIERNCAQFCINYAIHHNLHFRGIVELETIIVIDQEVYDKEFAFKKFKELNNRFNRIIITNDLQVNLVANKEKLKYEFVNKFLLSKDSIQEERAIKSLELFVTSKELEKDCTSNDFKMFIIEKIEEILAIVNNSLEKYWKIRMDLDKYSEWIEIPQVPENVKTVEFSTVLFYSNCAKMTLPGLTIEGEELEDGTYKLNFSEIYTDATTDILKLHSFLDKIEKCFNFYQDNNNFINLINAQNLSVLTNQIDKIKRLIDIKFDLKYMHILIDNNSFNYNEGNLIEVFKEEISKYIKNTLIENHNKIIDVSKKRNPIIPLLKDPKDIYILILIEEIKLKQLSFYVDVLKGNIHSLKDNISYGVYSHLSCPDIENKVNSLIKANFLKISPISDYSLYKVISLSLRIQKIVTDYAFLTNCTPLDILKYEIKLDKIDSNINTILNKFGVKKEEKLYIPTNISLNNYITGITELTSIEDFSINYWMKILDYIGPLTNEMKKITEFKYKSSNNDLFKKNLKLILDNIKDNPDDDNRKAIE